MKRIFLILLMSIITCTSSLAQDEQAHLSGSITYKGDVLQADDSSQTQHRIEAYARHKGFVGAGVDTIITPETAYSLFRPYATITNGIVSATAGYSTDSKNAEYAFAGIWLTPSFGKLSIFLDMRNYTALAGQGSSYQDNFLETSYPITEEVTIGLNAIYDHWWNNKLDIALVGPIAYYRVTDQVRIFARYSKEWAISNQKTDSADRFRIGMKFSF